MGSRERLWAKYGEATEIAAHETLNYAVLDEFVPRRLAGTWGFESVDYSP